jgi:serine/threonine-protein kinase
MGEVYRAHDIKLERDVALKILSSDLASSAEHLSRFEHEARAASSLNHPNIVAIYDVGRIDSISYIAMELVDGKDLRELINGTPMALNKMLRIASKLADGLAAAHERGIVHRDLKPENVMVSVDGFVKILDFGLAKLVRPITQDGPTVPHTMPGSVFGTVGYMSPEQASGKPIDFRSDQFSLGVILYEMASGKRPFDHETAPETMAAIIRESPRPLREINRHVSHELERVIMRCLAKERHERYASTRDLARDLREIRDGITGPSGPESAASGTFPAWNRRRMLPFASVVAGVAIAAAGIWWTVSQREPAPAARNVTSLAVLPFRDLSNAPDGRMYADGITETIASRLSRSRTLRVSSLTDGSDHGSLSDIAHRRKADLLLRGSIQRAGDQVRVNYALVDPKSGNEISGDSVTGALGQVFALEDAITEQVLQALRLRPAGMKAVATGLDRAADQKAYLEAVGLLVAARTQASVDTAIAKLESILPNARDSATLNSTLARALTYRYEMTRRGAALEEASIYAERAVQLDPGLAMAHIALGTVRRLTGHPEEALANYNHAVRLEPKSGEALLGLAETYDAMGRAADAEHAFEQAVALRPDLPGVLNRYGSYCFTHGKFEKAESLFRRSIEIVPDGARGYANLGGVLQAQGRNDEAIAAYEKSIALAPSATAYSNLGTLHFGARRYDQACAAFEKAAQMTPNRYTLWANLGDALRFSTARRAEAPAAYEKAIAAARTALKINASDALAHAVIASSLARRGEMGAAQKEIRAALQLDPASANVLYYAAVVAHARGDGDSAQSWMLRAVSAGFSRSELENDPELGPLLRQKT